GPKRRWHPRPIGFTPRQLCGDCVHFTGVAAAQYQRRTKLRRKVRNSDGYDGRLQRGPRVLSQDLPPPLGIASFARCTLQEFALDAQVATQVVNSCATPG